MSSNGIAAIDKMYDAADKIEAAMESAGAAGITPSLAGRAAKISTQEARVLLEWMVEHQFAHTSGNKGWTRYHAGRGR